MQARFVDVDGVPTRCLYAGKQGQDPILLIHGLTLNAEIWTRILDELGRRYFVVAPDLLGSGFSGPIDLDDQFLIARRVRHLGRLADAWGFDRFCACGSSYGALIAALLYFEQPQRVHRLVINGSSSAFNEEADLLSNLSRTLQTMKPFVANGTYAQWRERLGRGFHDGSKAPEEMTLSLMTSYGHGWAVRAWERSIEEMMDIRRFRRFRILDRLEEIDAETLVIWGRQDPGAKFEQARGAVKRMPRAKLLAFDECGHFPMLEHPQKFNEVLGDFLTGGLSAV